VYGKADAEDAAPACVRGVANGTPDALFLIDAATDAAKDPEDER
jgi:hypothetical protein